jgi:hypothetical protein
MHSNWNDIVLLYGGSIIIIVISVYTLKVKNLLFYTMTIHKQMNDFAWTDPQ